MSMFCKAKTPEFFKDLIHEAGRLLYTKDDKGNFEKIIYFSGTRVVIYEGEEIPEDLRRIIVGTGRKVSVLEFDEITGKLKVIE